MKAKLRIVCDRFYPYENNCTTKQAESLLWMMDLISGALPDADKYSPTRFYLCLDQFNFGDELFDYIGIKECTITQ